MSAKLSERINGLPNWARDYIHDLETRCDITGDIRMIHIQKETIAYLEQQLAAKDAEIARLSQNIANMSDGHHTFAELYEHRHALFSVVCKQFGGWKTKLHEDGTMYEGWFLAGVNTPKGTATYHLPLSWWDRFDVQEIERAPHWDGHTPNDVIQRIAALAETPAHSIDYAASTVPIFNGHNGYWVCTCGWKGTNWTAHTSGRNEAGSANLAETLATPIRQCKCDVDKGYRDPGCMYCIPKSETPAAPKEPR